MTELKFGMDILGYKISFLIIKLPYKKLQCKDC